MDIYLPIAGQSVNALFIVVLGFLGSIVGAALFRLLQASGQIDIVIGFLYVLILGWIGGLMLKDGLKSLGLIGPKVEVAPRARHNRWVASLPLRWRFHGSGLYISPIAPFALGFVAGTLTVLLGIGGGFILVPAMIYLLGMPARVVIGTSLFMVLAVIILLVALRMALGLAWHPDEIFSIEYL